MIAHLTQYVRTWFGWEPHREPSAVAATPSSSQGQSVAFATPLSAPLLLPRPSLAQLAGMPQDEWPPFVRESAAARKYIDLLGGLAWANFPPRHEGPARRGPQPAPDAPVVAAFLVKLDKGLPSMAKLRQELVEQPALTWALGFPLLPSAEFSYGFDVAQSLPSHRHLSRLLRKLPQAQMQFLLKGTVQLFQDELPPDLYFGDEICGDTKHIIAWVRENNPKEKIRGGRFHQERQPRGDKDCKVGFKANGNRMSSSASPTSPSALTSEGAAVIPTTAGLPASGSLPKPKDGQYYWGYASGVVVTQAADGGEVVLAELTQTFDHSDESYFFPLMAQTEVNLGRKPKFGAWDAAYDTFYVHEYFTLAGGFAAVPWATRTDQKKTFSPEGLPLCAAGLVMPLKSRVQKKSGCLVPHELGRYACPLLFPDKTGEICPINHPNWQRTGTDQGCITALPTSVGARARHELDRESEAFHRLYDQRSAVERINSQAVALGIERPHLRNQNSITGCPLGQNTLIYVLINLRTWQRGKEKKAQMQRNC